MFLNFGHVEGSVILFLDPIAITRLGINAFPWSWLAYPAFWKFSGASVAGRNLSADSAHLLDLLVPAGIALKVSV